MIGLRRKLRKLHAPDAAYGWPVCDGCDAEGFDAGPPEWPCRTAEVVFTNRQLKRLTREFEAAREERRAQQSGELSSLSGLIQSAYDRYLEFALSAPVFGAFPGGKTPEPIAEPTVTIVKRSGLARASSALIASGVL